MDRNKIAKEQLLHLAFGAAFFLIIGVVAVTLDLASSWIQRFGVSEFTSDALELTAHAMLVLDLVRFFIYLAVIERVKGMMK